MSMLDVFKASAVKEENQRLVAEDVALKKELAEVRALLTEIGGIDAERAKPRHRNTKPSARS